MINIKVTKGKNSFMAEDKNLCILVMGNTVEEALQEFCMMLSYFKEHYEELGDNEVTGDAVRLKKLYAGLKI